MLDLLILTAGYGEGHNAAARGLLAAAQQLGARAEIADPFTALPSYERSRRDYLWLINHAPKVWAFVFGLIDRWPLVEFSLPLLHPVQAELARILEEKQPKAVVSVYPAYAFLLRRLYPQGRPFPLHTVVTDSITINSVWHQAPSDSYLVPNEATAAVLRAQGVPATRVRTTGFPVNPRFAGERPPRPDPRKGARVLFMVNAGKDTAHHIVARLLEVPGVQLSVTVGKDEALRARVVAAAAGRPVEIHGWTPHMPELLMSHHLLIGKAGGATVQETIAAQTPMLITQVVPGQEEGNARLLFEHGCAALCPTSDALAQKIEELFAGDAHGWHTWAEKIRALSRPAAALEIVRELTAR
jgi:processive 1,2-diacylglycerol beta-glucosyltransferase